jgi:hypothetical protein
MAKRPPPASKRFLYRALERESAAERPLRISAKAVWDRDFIFGKNVMDELLEAHVRGVIGFGCIVSTRPEMFTVVWGLRMRATVSFYLIGQSMRGISPLLSHLGNPAIIEQSRKPIRRRTNLDNPALRS